MLPPGWAASWILNQSLQEHFLCSLTSTFFLLLPPSLLLPSWLFTLFQAPLSHPIHHRGPDPHSKVSHLPPRWPHATLACVSPSPPQHILLLGSASPIIVPSASPPVKPQGPEKSLLASLLTQVLRVLQADALHFGTDKPHKWTHLCPECQPPQSLHVSLLTSATRSSLAPLSVCECERACYLREAA